MQNRFVMTGIPAACRQSSGYTSALKEFVESRTCWLDRFAWLSSESDPCSSHSHAAAFELHLENWRDPALELLNGREVVLSTNQAGEMRSILGDWIAAPANDNDDGGRGSDDDDEEAMNGLSGAALERWLRGDDDEPEAESQASREDANGKEEKGTEETGEAGEADLRFVAHVAAATAAQSAELVARCPDNGKKHALAGDKNEQERVRTLSLRAGRPSSSSATKPLTLRVHLGSAEGGTGSETWKGGIMLAELLHARLASGDRLFASLVNGADVIELGAGCSALPSMALAKTCRRLRASGGPRPRTIIATDGIDEIVSRLQVNVLLNSTSSALKVRQLDWSSLVSKQYRAKMAAVLRARGSNRRVLAANLVLFSDCLYSLQAATLLFEAIDSLLVEGGAVIGVLPHPREGVEEFLALMKRAGFQERVLEAVESPALDACSEEFKARCAGSHEVNYRIRLWQK